MLYACGLEVQTGPEVCHVCVQCNLLCPPVTPTISDSSPGPVTSTPTKGTDVDISDINDLESTTVDATESTAHSCQLKSNRCI